MSNLPLPSAGLHNDDHDDPVNPTYQKLPSMTGRITSLELLKHHQHSETRSANEQACDEIHELQPRNSSKKKTNSEKAYSKSSKSVSPHQLMQSNYYDQTRFDSDYPLVNHPSESGQININVDDYKDYKKKYTPACSSENRSDKDRSTSPPFGETSASIEQSVTQSVGRLLQSNKSEQYQSISIKTNPKSHEQTTVHGASTGDDHQERSVSPSSSSDCSTDDSTASNKRPKDNEKTNIPYEKLLNDEDEDEEMIEQPTKLATESSTLLNKNLSQTYGTQSTTNERAKYLSNNGYNSHGSSITTKSSSDNSGSIRTNSGSDNDEESDEEHYNNSTVSNNPSSISIYSHMHDSSIKSTNNKKSNDIRHANSNEGNHYLFRPSNPSHPEQIVNKDEPLGQVPRFKQHPGDDSNVNSPPDSNLPPNSSKQSSQQSSTNQTNTSSLSSSQYNRNHLEQQEQSSTSSRHNSHPQATRKTKKRKQSHQQDIIRTELIPGHRGDRDVDELVKFIDGNPFPLCPTDTNKPRIASKNNSINEGNSNKSLARKKSRKSTKSISATNDHEDEQINQSPPEQQNLSTESHLNTIEIHPTKTTNGETSLSSWFEQTRDQSSEKQDSPSSAIISRSNSEIVSEPFVTVTHRRRVVKERRQDQQPVPHPSRFPPPSSNSVDKRRFPSAQQNGMGRPTISTKSEQPSSIIKEENHQPKNPPPLESLPPSTTTTTTSNTNPITDQSLEKHQSSPRLSSHSSSSSLSSLLKRQAKPPAVVFLNKPIDFELKDVSFGFDLDSATLDPTSTALDDKPPTIEQESENVLYTSISSSSEPSQSNDVSSQKSFRKFPQRNPRGPQFYSGSDIRPQQHRTYPTPPIPQSSYIDPRLLLQYHQQGLSNYPQVRFTNYPQHLAYMNLLPPQYLPTQSPYMYPTYPTNESEASEEANHTATDQVQVVYATPTGQIYFSSATTKKPYGESESVVTPMSTGYPTPYFYPQQVQHIIPTQPPYFQPISSIPLVIDTKAEPNESDEVVLEDDYDNSRKFSQPKRQQSSADIMSNALQLVYSQQRRNAQTDRFNLDDLTAYLAMKWTDAVDHHAQGDSRIILVDEQ